MPRTPTPMSGGTEALPDNRLTYFDFGSIEPGEIVHVRTGQSDWYFTRTARSRVTRDQVHGVFVQTNSRTFGQILRSPRSCMIDRAIEVGQQIHINGRRATGSVESISLDGRLLT